MAYKVNCSLDSYNFKNAYYFFILGNNLSSYFMQNPSKFFCLIFSDLCLEITPDCLVNIPQKIHAHNDQWTAGKGGGLSGRYHLLFGGGIKNIASNAATFF